MQSLGDRLSQYQLDYDRSWRELSIELGRSVTTLRKVAADEPVSRRTAHHISTRLDQLTAVPPATNRKETASEVVRESRE